MRLRVGRKVGRTLYLQKGDQPSDDDQLVGMVDGPMLAQEIVKAYNAAQAQPHRADGHACTANLPPPLGRPCSWCGAQPYVMPGAVHGPVERVPWGSQRHRAYEHDLLPNTPCGDCKHPRYAHAGPHGGCTEDHHHCGCSAFQEPT